MNQKLKLNAFKIMKNDYLASLCVMAPLVVWGVFLYLSFGGYVPEIGHRSELTNNDASTFLYMGIVVSVICIPILILRINKIKLYFTNGIDIAAKITYISSFRGRARIEYEYNYDNKIYKSANLVIKTNDTNHYEINDKVNLLILKEKANKAIIKELFL